MTLAIGWSHDPGDRHPSEAATTGNLEGRDSLFSATHETIVAYIHAMERIKLVDIGSPVLRERATPVSLDVLRLGALSGLLEEMRDTLKRTGGVGVAAPQLGQSLQLLAYEVTDDFIAKFSPDAVAALQIARCPFQVLVNPVLKIVDTTPAETAFEGCLNPPGFIAITPRAREVVVTALDHTGQETLVPARGYLARILQHEVDHLSGTLYLDRMVSRTFMSLAARQEHWGGRPPSEILREMQSA